MKAIHRRHTSKISQESLVTSEQQARIARGRTDKLWFAQYYFPENTPKDFAFFHQDFFELCEVADTPVLISAFRGAGKTSLITFIDKIHKIVYQRRKFIVIGSFNQSSAIQFTRAIKDALETNERLQADFGNVIGDTQWQAADFITSTGVRVVALGAGQSLRNKIDLRTGTRPDELTIDDLENDISARSAYQSQNLIDWIFKGALPAMRSPELGGCSIQILGTLITPVSAITQLFKDEERPIIKRKYPIFDEQGQSSWPEVFTLEVIETKHKEVKLIAWHSEYLLDPLSSEFQLFQEAWLRPPPESLATITDWTRTVGAIDPSATQHGDYKAIIIVGLRDADKCVYVRHVWCRQASVEDMLAKMHELHDLYECDLWIEDNALKEFLYEAITAYEARHDCRLQVRGVQHSQKKTLRIESLQSPFERGIIYLDPLHSDTAILRDQLLEYPTGQHDDAPDALSEAYLRVLNPKSRQPAWSATTKQPPTRSSIFKPVRTM